MTSLKDVFKNRIIGYGTKPADQFQANPLNPRTHPQKQRDAVQASLRELGWIGVVVENTVTGNLIDGHERVWQALPNNEDVPYIQVSLTEAEEKLALAIFDPLSAMAVMDGSTLDALLREVNTGEAALQGLLSELAENSGLYGYENKSLDELGNEYGDEAERAFWPLIKVQVSPDTKARWDELMEAIDGDEAAKVDILLGAVDESLFNAEPS